MKKSILITILFFAFLFSGLAQHSKALIMKNEGTKTMGAASHSSQFTVSCKGLVNNPSVDLQWRPIITPAPIIHGSDETPLVRQLKAERMLQKLQLENNKSAEGENSTLSLIPEMGRNFSGNASNGTSPLDNSLAISNGGIIISVANTTIGYSDMDGQISYYKDLLSFISDTTIHGVCDPVVIYDSGSDRFIFFCQVSPLNSVKSKLLLFFSKTNNPADGWWYYKLTGNPLSDASAFDYPKLAVSNNELYITGNLYFDNGQYNQSVIYQINKTGGFSGQNINWQYWHNISGNPFTVTPLQWGQQGNYGPGCYFVASSTSDDSTIKFYDLTDDMTGTPSLVYHPVNVTAYKLAPDALQKGTTVKLNTNDCRMLSGFYLNGYAHFVYNSEFSAGYCGINYHRLKVSDLTDQSIVFGQSGSDYTYPSVVSFAADPTDNSVMIGFLKASSSTFPSIRVVNCDNDFNWSGSTEVKAGENYTYYTGDPERWGDYSGTSRKHNSVKPSIWMSGMYGNTQNKWDSWIAEVYNHAWGIETPGKEQTVNVFPNPVTDQFTVEFSLAGTTPLTITLADERGGLVKALFAGNGYAGKNIFSFNKSPLKPGIYFLILKTDSSVLKNEKIIITD
ncbi:MAG: T9SS type A sorting domain-containing protein [Bacteroidota bacterium]